MWPHWPSVHGPAWLSPLPGPLRSVFFFTCALCNYFFPLSAVSNMLLGSTVEKWLPSSPSLILQEVWAVSRASPLLMHHPAISTLPLCGKRHLQPATSQCSRKRGEHCFLSVPYPQTHWGESSVVLPRPRCGPTWLHNHSLLRSVPVPSFQRQKVIPLGKGEG